MPFSQASETGVSSAESSSMSSAAVDRLTDTCRIGRISAGAYAELSTGKACRADLAGSNFEVMGDYSYGSVLLWAVQVLLATSVLPGDEIDKGSQYFYVMDTDKGRTGALTLTAYCFRLASITW